jgi:transcriptional regulator with XRE-family HTH domain
MPHPSALSKAPKSLQLRTHPGAPTNLSTIFARNLRRLRNEQNHSLESLAEIAGIDAPVLDQAETGKVEPSLEFAWRIANALKRPFAALLADQAPRGSIVLRKSKAKTIVSDSLGLTTRALFPPHADQGAEFYELKLAPLHRETFEPHKAGTVEILFVAEGELEVSVGREPDHRVEKGDSICYPADLPHSYRNLSRTPATLYLVMTYAGAPDLDESGTSSVHQPWDETG